MKEKYNGIELGLDFNDDDYSEYSGEAGKGKVFKTLGASNHTDHERAWGDYYATEPRATEWLLKLEHFDGPILEPACGEGHISKVLVGGGYERYKPGFNRPWFRRASRLSFHRQYRMERRHHNKPTLCRCSRVCGESIADYTERAQSRNVSETDIPGRKSTKASFSYTTTHSCMGKFITTAMRHERRLPTLHRICTCLRMVHLGKRI